MAPFGDTKPADFGIKKPVVQSWMTGSILAQSLLFCRRFFGLDDGLFAFDVGLAAFFMFVFIVLFAHKCLYIVRGLRFCV